MLAQPEGNLTGAAMPIKKYDKAQAAASAAAANLTVWGGGRVRLIILSYIHEPYPSFYSLNKIY